MDIIMAGQNPGMARVFRRDKRDAFKHLTCPVFSSGGAALCEDFCLPLVAGLTEAICPS